MTQRDRLILSIFATAATLAAFWFLVLGPKRDEAVRLEAEVASAQTKLDGARTAIAAAEAAKRSYGGDYAELARMGKAVPADDDTASLVYQLESAAKRANIDFRSIRIEGAGASASAAPAAGAAGTTPATPATPPAPGTVPGPGGLSQMPFKVIFEGTFFELRRFLRLVESFTTVKGERLDVRGRLLTLDGVGLTPAADGLPNVKASIVASAYLAPEPVTLDAPAAAAAPATAPTTTASSGATPTPVAASTPSSPPGASK